MFFKRKNRNPWKETEFSCSRDDLTIRGTEYRLAGDHLPIAIVCHGFMAFQDTVRQYAKAFAQMGYVSYCFDFCGGSVVMGKSSGKTTEMSVLTEVKDLEAVIEYAKSRRYTDANRILLMGCSQGGFVCGITAAKHKEEISKLVMFYPALCIPDDARAGKMMFANFDPSNLPEIIPCGPMKLGRCYVEDVIGMNPYEEIVDYTGDVLIVHGDKDSIVHVSYSQNAYNEYKVRRAKEPEKHPVTLKIIQNGKHGFSKHQDEMAIEYLKEECKL